MWLLGSSMRGPLLLYIYIKDRLSPHVKYFNKQQGLTFSLPWYNIYNYKAFRLFCFVLVIVLVA